MKYVWGAEGLCENLNGAQPTANQQKDQQKNNNHFIQGLKKHKEQLKQNGNKIVMWSEFNFSLRWCATQNWYN